MYDAEEFFDALEAQILEIFFDGYEITVGSFLIEFEGFEDDGDDEFSLEYRFDSPDVDELYSSSDEWMDDLSSYLEGWVQQKSKGLLTLENVNLSYGSLVFGLDIAIILAGTNWTLKHIKEIVDSLNGIHKAIADFLGRISKG
jgi:hypothetical protein